jgi:hypothetical protein
VATLNRSPADYLRSALGAKARILLINPPVQEKRYHWLRWNQPTELLRLATWLKAQHKAVDVRLFDFMFPSPSGEVARHKVKETWVGPRATALWHFGRPFEEFVTYLDELVKSGWTPDLVLISSLTSYWHSAIEKLLLRVCNVLGPHHRPRTTIALYGAYPSIEPEHAERQLAADIAFTGPVDVRMCEPAFALYFDQWRSAPLYYGLDIDAPDVCDHLSACIEQQSRWDRRRGISRDQTITAAFLNDDLCGPGSGLPELAKRVDQYKRRVRIEAICGVKPGSVTIAHLGMLERLGLKSLFIEYATRADGSLDEQAYRPLREFLASDRERRRLGNHTELASRDATTAFVNVGLPSDDIETIVRNTLVLNRYFQSIILKPFGFSPDIDPAPAALRRERWPLPAFASPQWFPYIGHGSSLSFEDYDNLMRWQGVMSKRVKSVSFDFLGDGSVPRLVRETLVEESWKQGRHGQQ